MQNNMAPDPLTVTSIKEGALRNGFLYDNRVFFSHQEVLCYKYLQRIGIPGRKMHMEFRVGRKHFDFFPLKRVFWEHHPILQKFGKDPIRYGENRRAALDEQGYVHIPLVVSSFMFRNVSDIQRKMVHAGVDFRTGKVPESGIVYITGRLEEREKMVVELLKEPLLF
jgi:hypothetical protein